MKAATQIARPDFSRVNVVGTSGAGKSTFAQQLAEKIGSVKIEMDQLFWLPNWTQPSDEVFFAKLENALTQPRWVLDGNYDRTLDIKWRNVTTVIWIDFSLPRTVRQAVQRALIRSIHRRELWLKPAIANRF